MTTPTTQQLEEKRARLRRWVSTDGQQSVTRGVDHVAVFAKDATHPI